MGSMTKTAVISFTLMWQTTSTPTKAVSMRNCSRCDLLFVASELARAGLRSNPKKVAEALPERAQSPGQGHYVLERQPGPARASSLATKAVSMRNRSRCDLLFVASELARAGLRSNPKKIAAPCLKERNHPPRPLRAQREQARSPQRQGPCAIAASAMCRLAL